MQPHLTLGSRRPPILTEFGLVSAQGHDHISFTTQLPAQVAWIWHLQKAEDEFRKQR